MLKGGWLMTETETYSAHCRQGTTREVLEASWSEMWGKSTALLEWGGSKLKDEREAGPLQWAQFPLKSKPAEITRNSLKHPKHPEIWSEVEWGVTSYRFAYWYEIFRSFRPERNGIYNFDENNTLNSVEKIYQTKFWFSNLLKYHY